jgi:hypothetical protein
MRSQGLARASGAVGRERIGKGHAWRVGFGALALTGALVALGCGASSDVAATSRQDAAPVAGQSDTAASNDTALSAPAGPVMVSCGEGQRAMVRQVAMDGQLVSQIDCVSAHPAVAPQHVAQPAAPVHFAQPAYHPVAYPVASVPVYPAPAPAPAVVRTTQPERVVRYEPRQARREVPPKQNRSWQKSAVIIGSSAGVGAGVGGAVGGKKGALVGAAIGGGSATIWDQATRRN